MKTDIYKTKDLYEASTLYALGHEFLGTHKTGNTYYFSFADKSKCLEERNKYWSYQNVVAPKKFADSIKSLKEIIFSGANNA